MREERCASYFFKTTRTSNCEGVKGVYMGRRTHARWQVVVLEGSSAGEREENQHGAAEVFVATVGVVVGLFADVVAQRTRIAS